MFQSQIVMATADRDLDHASAHSPQPIPGLWVVMAMVASLFAVAVLLHATHLAVDSRSFANLVLLAGGAIAIVTLFSLRAPQTETQRVWRDGCEFVGLFVFVSILGALASYPVAKASNGFIDPLLERADQWLGFDWLAWYRVVVAHPSLQVSGAIAYDMIYVTPAILLGHWAIADGKAEARQFIATFWIAAIITLIVFVQIPAQGPLAMLWHGPIPYMPSSALYQSELIPALRDHEMRTVALGALRGLVCAPSFHTTSAVLYIVAAWPIAKLRWPVLAINLAMLLSTPVEGTHYLVDMVGGAVVAFMALALAASVKMLATRRADQSRPSMWRALRMARNPVDFARLRAG